MGEERTISDLIKEHLDRVEARARIEKLLLEQEKLQLEKRTLGRQISWHGTLLDWLKAATVPAALGGVIVTYVIGSGQFREAELSRTADRFDKALTRLASDKPGDRVTGISGLRLFLQEPDRARYATLHFLINALSLEKEPLVQNAILDVFAGQEVKGIGAVALNEALTTAVERNRSLTASILHDSPSRKEKDRRQKPITKP